MTLTFMHIKWQKRHLQVAQRTLTIHGNGKREYESESRKKQQQTHHKPRLLDTSTVDERGRE